MYKMKKKDKGKKCKCGGIFFKYKEIKDTFTNAVKCNKCGIIKYGDAGEVF